MSLYQISYFQTDSLKGNINKDDSLKLLVLVPKFRLPDLCLDSLKVPNFRLVLGQCESLKVPYVVLVHVIYDIHNISTFKLLRRKEYFQYIILFRKSFFSTLTANWKHNSVAYQVYLRVHNILAYISESTLALKCFEHMLYPLG